MHTFLQNNPTMNDHLFVAINQSIEEWVELKHVIDVYGSGGPKAYEKLKWMGQVLYDYFKNYPQEMILDEIYEYISQMIDNEFSFIPLDNSLEIFVNKLLRYYKLNLAGQVNEIISILHESKLKHLEKKAKQAQNVENINELFSNVNVSKQKEEKNLTTQDGLEEDSEWTLVLKRKNRK